MGWTYQHKPPMGWPLDYDSGLVPDLGFWPMLAGSGDTVQDLSGNGHPGIFGAGAVSPAWTTGPLGPAVNFDGGDVIEMGDKAIYEGMTQLTVIAWVYHTGSSLDNIASKAHSDPSWSLECHSGFPRFRTWTSGGYVEGDYTVNNPNVWQHAAGVYDGSNQMVYVNGVLVRSDAQTGTINSGSDSLAIGALSDNEGARTAYWEGDIDVVSIYSWPLTAYEINFLFQYPCFMFKDPDEVALLGAYQEAAPGGAAPTGNINGPLVGCLGGVI